MPAVSTSTVKTRVAQRPSHREGALSTAESASLGATDPLRAALAPRILRAIRLIMTSADEAALVSAASAPTDVGSLLRFVANANVAVSQSGEEPLNGALARAITHRQQLLERAGEMLSSAQVGELLGIRRQSVDKRRNSHRLLGLKQGSDWIYPAVQFKDGDLLSGLDRLLAAHRDDDPWHVLDVLLAPDQSLGGCSLLQVLRDGDGALLERHIAQVAGDGFT